MCGPPLLYAAVRPPLITVVWPQVPASGSAGEWQVVKGLSGIAAVDIRDVCGLAFGKRISLSMGLPCGMQIGIARKYAGAAGHRSCHGDGDALQDDAGLDEAVGSDESPTAAQRAAELCSLLGDSGADRLSLAALAHKHQAEGGWCVLQQSPLFISLPPLHHLHYG